MPSFIFLKAVKEAELESLLGQFWPTSLLFDIPALDYIKNFKNGLHKHGAPLFLHQVIPLTVWNRLPV